MATSNRLAGSDPSPSAGSSADGPVASLAGTLGAAPQAAPSAPANMLGASPQAPQPGMIPAPDQGAPLVPPSREMLMEAMQKQGYVARALKTLLSKPDLKDKDVLDAVGEAVADQIMTPYQAAGYLKDLPTGDDPLQVRQWIAGHYANASQALQTVAEMIGAHGAMTRQQQAAPQIEAPPAAPPPNAFSAMGAPSSAMLQ